MKRSLFGACMLLERHATLCSNIRCRSATANDAARFDHTSRHDDWVCRRPGF